MFNSLFFNYFIFINKYITIKLNLKTMVQNDIVFGCGCGKPKPKPKPTPNGK